MKKINFFSKNPNNIFMFLLLVVMIVIMIGVVVFPSVFYDQWIWKYYWGPVVADAAGGTAVYKDITAYEGYTIVSEITYGLILICALYVIYQILKKLEIVVNWKFALALMPYILFGPITRVLEDTIYFGEPWVYWFISPLIYLQISLYALFFVFLGYFLEKKYDKKEITVNNVVFIGGLIILVPPVLLIIKWLLGDQWSTTTGLRFDVFFIVIAVILLIIGILYLFTEIFKKKKDLLVYRNPLNLAMLFGHLLDGVTSYISIKDPLDMGLNYAEKHPASNALLNIWGPLFPITKFILIIVVIYVFDVLYKEEFKNYMTLVNLLKIGILILGFSPGLRDILRVTMGV